MKKVLFTICFLTAIASIAQTGKGTGIEFRPQEPVVSTYKISCSRLYKKVTSEGIKKKTIHTDDIEWIDKALLYKHRGQNYVVTYLKGSKGFRPYIYCNISIRNWELFSNNRLNDFGKSFNRYIKQNKCNCL